jgi:hypothetical protein
MEAMNMSYTIEYNAEVYKVPAEWESSSENSYLLIITQGDNNVYEADNKRRARDTDIVAFGWAYSVIGKVCYRAAACEGGGLVINGKSITPEGYIKRFRDKIKSAPLIIDFFNQHKTARFKIDPDPESTYDKERLEKYKDYITEESNYYDKDKKELWANVRIDSKEEFEKFRDLWAMAKYPECIGLEG